MLEDKIKEILDTLTIGSNKYIKANMDKFEEIYKEVAEFLKKHNFDPKENTTHYKITPEEITSKDGLKKFIEFLENLLQDLSASRNDWKPNKQ